MDRRTCAEVPGLRNRNYFGGVGSPGQATGGILRASEKRDVKSQEMAEGHSQWMNLFVLLLTPHESVQPCHVR